MKLVVLIWLELTGLTQLSVVSLFLLEVEFLNATGFAHVGLIVQTEQFKEVEKYDTHNCFVCDKIKFLIHVI